METRAILVEPLKGIDQRWSTPAASAARIRDMWWDPRGGWSSSGGYRRIILGPAQEGGGYTNPFATVGAISSIHWFSQHNGARRWLVYLDSSGNLRVFNPSIAARAGNPGNAATDRDNNTITWTIPSTPWQKAQSATWGDSFYLVNGINRPLVFNGYWWDYAGFAQAPAAPTARTLDAPHCTTHNPGAGSPEKIRTIGLGPVSDIADTDYVCGYRWRCSFVNSRGQESPLSEPSELVSFTNEGGTGEREAAHVAFLTIPTGGSEVVARRLYRTQNTYDASSNPVAGRSEQFFYHSTIPDNATTSIMDSKTDAMLGSVAVNPASLGAWPLQAKFIAPFKGCMFASGAGNSYVYFSAPGEPEVWPLDNRIDVGDAHLGPITGMYVTRNALVIFKGRGIYLVRGDQVNGFRAETLTREVGCAAPNTICEVPGTGLMFVAERAIYVLKGALENEGYPTKVIPLGVPLPAWLPRFNKSAILNACAAVYHRDREVWFAVPTIGSATNNLILVFHYEIEEWSYRESFPVASILETADPAGHLLFGSHDTNHLGIMVYSRGWSDKDGTAVAPLYETGPFSPGGDYRSMRPKGVIVKGILHGNNDLTLNVRTNRSQSSWFTTAKSQDQQLPQDTSPVYGTATFDTIGTLWQQWRPGPMRFDIERTVGIGPVLTAALTFAPASGTRMMTLIGLSLEVGLDDPNPVKPLRPTGTGS